MICGIAGTLAPAPAVVTAGSDVHGRGPWARAAEFSVSQPSAGQASGSCA